MDILAICGSPRKHMTTHSVLQAVLNGAGRSHEIIWPAFMKSGTASAARRASTRRRADAGRMMT